MGAVEQEMLLKSSEQFEIDRTKQAELQKKELGTLNDKIKLLERSEIEKDKEINEWKKISEDNIKKTGNSDLRDLKLKTKEVDT